MVNQQSPLDDYVSDINPERIVDVFVDELDLLNLGSNQGEPDTTDEMKALP